jgi:hypothetical protein
VAHLAILDIAFQCQYGIGESLHLALLPAKQMKHQTGSGLATDTRQFTELFYSSLEKY